MSEKRAGAYAILAAALLFPALAACAMGADISVSASTPPRAAVRSRFVHAYAKAGSVTVVGEVFGRPGPILVTVTVEGCGTSSFASILPHPPRAMAQTFSRRLSCPTGVQPGLISVTADPR